MEGKTWRTKLYNVKEMDKGFKKVLLLNLLIVIELIPAILILNSLMLLTTNMVDKGIFLWVSVGIIAFIIINYLIWRCDKAGKKDRC